LSENKWPFGWSSPDLVIWETPCSHHPQPGNRSGHFGHSEWLHRARLHWGTGAEEQLPGARTDAPFLVVRRPRSTQCFWPSWLHGWAAELFAPRQLTADPGQFSDKPRKAATAWG